MIKPEQDAWLKATFKINVNHAEVDAEATTDLGMKPKARMEEYDGEFDKVAWRSTNPEVAEQKYAATRKFSDDEVNKHSFSADDEGKLVNSDGDMIKDNTQQLMSVDPDTGEITISDEEYFILRQMNEDGTPSDNFESIPPTRDARLDARRRAKESGGKLRMENLHHSSVAQGKEVASAGHIDTKDGKVTRIDNSSGHYRPAFEHLLQVVEHLLKTGAMLDTTIVDKDGDDLEDSNPKAFKLYEKTQALIHGLSADKAVLKKLAAAADKGGDPAKLQSAKETYDKKVETINGALDAMKKMGIGPANKITGQVDLTYAESTGTGAEFRQSSEEEELSTEEFLMGKDAKAGIEELAREDEDDDDLELESYILDDDNQVQGDAPNVYGQTAYLKSDGQGEQYADPTVAYSIPDDPEESDDDDDADIEVEKTPFRDFDNKKDMLAELKKVAAEKKLRPEDRDNAAELIKESVAPDIDESKWQDNVEKLLSTAKDLLGEDDDDDDDDDFLGDAPDDEISIFDGKVMKHDSATGYELEIGKATDNMEVIDGELMEWVKGGLYPVDLSTL
ncbi:MAG: hypothetical protein ABJX32_04070 [Tateyamaria sp.]|uniref:hypothetical protein n=1 Tax=Tateyamaria sp. TaxID=1929288 RepID=UPI0032A0F2B9